MKAFEDSGSEDTIVLACLHVYCRSVCYSIAGPRCLSNEVKMPQPEQTGVLGIKQNAKQNAKHLADKIAKLPWALVHKPSTFFDLQCYWVHICASFSTREKEACTQSFLCDVPLDLLFSPR